MSSVIKGRACCDGVTLRKKTADLRIYVYIIKYSHKRMERQSKEPRDLEAYCSGGQGPPPQAVAPSGGIKYGHYVIHLQHPTTPQSPIHQLQ